MNESRERFLLTELRRDEKKTKIAFLLVGVMLVILIANVIYLIKATIIDKNQLSQDTKTTALPVTTLSPTPCSDCLSPIPSVLPSPTPVVTTQTAVGSPKVLEYFIPLGSGTSQAGDWTDVPGVQATVDFGSYQNISDIRFETSVSIPTNNETVSLRLFNVTDKHPVWNSDVSLSTNNFAVSPALIYDKGQKTYQVQMKTSLLYPANLNQARIHITLQ